MLGRGSRRGSGLRFSFSVSLFRNIKSSFAEAIDIILDESVIPCPKPETKEFPGIGSKLGIERS